MIGWLCTFIVQCYCLSFWFSNKRSAIKSLNWVYIGINLALSAILLKIYDISRTRNMDTLYNIFTVLCPTFANIGFYSKHISSYDELKSEDLTEILIKSAICTGLFFVLAIVLDYRNTRIQSGGLIGAAFVDERAINQAFMPETVRAEGLAASQPNPQNPIQCRSIYMKFTDTFFAL